MKTIIKHNGARLYPPGTRKNNPYYVARARIRGRVVEISTKRTDESEARSYVDSFMTSFEEISRIDTEVDQRFLANGDLPVWARRLYRGARERSTRAGIPFRLTYEEMSEIVERAQGRCEFSGVPFSYDRPARATRRRPFVPSLDRKIPEAGYTLENCRLVAFSVNVALSDWGDEVLNRIIIWAAGSNVGKNVG